MTTLTNAVRGELADDPAIASLLVTNKNGWDVWVFPNQPFGVIENTGKALIVVNVFRGWSDKNPHNTMSFPQLTIDIWADPDRDAHHSVTNPTSAYDRIDDLKKLIDKKLHTVNLDRPGGKSIIWGSNAQKQRGAGVRILGSESQGEPEIRPIKDIESGKMGTLTYNVSL